VPAHLQLVEEHHGAEVANALVREALGHNQLHALELEERKKEKKKQRKKLTKREKKNEREEESSPRAHPSLALLLLLPYLLSSFFYFFSRIKKNLAKVCRVAEHVDVEQLRHIAAAVLGILRAEALADLWRAGL
jgi:hypothetical protein